MLYALCYRLYFLKNLISSFLKVCTIIIISIWLSGQATEPQRGLVFSRSHMVSRNVRGRTWVQAIQLQIYEWIATWHYLDFEGICVKMKSSYTFFTNGHDTFLNKWKGDIWLSIYTSNFGLKNDWKIGLNFWGHVEWARNFLVSWKITACFIMDEWQRLLGKQGNLECKL